MLESDIPTHYAYLAERLVVQCTVLSEALARKKKYVKYSILISYIRAR